MSTSYLNRPVLDFTINWASEPAKDLAYDLRTRVLGFAVPRFEQLQGATKATYTGSIRLSSEADIVAWRAFMAQIRGRVGSFWFPAPLATMQIEPDLSGTSDFMIRDQNLRDWWQDHPCRYLCFRKPGQPLQCGKIGSVEVTTDGREVVHLAAALGTEIDQTWDCCKLLYGRMVEDQDRFEFIADNVAQKTFKVVELPEDYADVEVAIVNGTLKIFLYEFQKTLGNQTTTWRRTSLRYNVTSNSQLFYSAAIEHSGLVRTNRPTDETLTITTWRDADNPLTQFVPFAIDTTMTVKIWEVVFPNYNTRTLIYSGRVLGVKPHGKQITATCGHPFWSLRFPRFYISPYCNRTIYQTDCGVVVGSYTALGTISSVSGRYLKVAVSSPPISGKTDSANVNYFSLGWLETVTASTFQIRGITQSSARDGNGDMIVILDAALAEAAVGHTVKLVAGCDGQRQTCDTKFGNFRRWGGHTIPADNTTIDPMENQLQDQGKK